MEENLKKALSELLVLALLHQREHHAPELTEAISVQSGGAVNISFPYAILYRMIDHGYIRELPKRIAPDGRRGGCCRLPEVPLRRLLHGPREPSEDRRRGYVHPPACE